MRTKAILKRFEGVPDDFAIEKAVLLTQWNLWREGDRIDAQSRLDGIKGPSRLCFRRLRQSLEELGHPATAYLNMEFGPRMIELVPDGPRLVRERMETLAHIGLVSSLCRECGTEVLGYYQAVYTQGDKATDRVAWALAGGPREIVLDLYGVPDTDWITRQALRWARARDLADWCGGSVTAFVGPWIGSQRRTLEEWRNDLVSIRRFTQIGVDTVVFWADGGPGETDDEGNIDRTDYREIEPYVEAFAAEFGGGA